MEPEHKARIRERFSEMEPARIESLDVPDDYTFMHGELVELIREGTEYWLAEVFNLEPKPEPERSGAEKPCH